MAGQTREQLHDAANGWDHSPVRPAGETPPPSPWETASPSAGI
ncbi:MAG: hypothetical protein ACLR1T_18085 [Evtepia gabavorous]